MSQIVANSLKMEFEGLTDIEVIATYIEKGPTHSPTALRSGMQGVYVFLIETHCFKVGKAGPKSKARWNSHHYNLDDTTPSTLPKSIMRDKSQFKDFPVEMHAEIDVLGKPRMQDWIKNNMSRIEFLIKDNGDPYTLNLLEALVQFRLKPIYEGKTA